MTNSAAPRDTPEGAEAFADQATRRRGAEHPVSRAGGRTSNPRTVSSRAVGAHEGEPTIGAATVRTVGGLDDALREHDQQQAREAARAARDRAEFDRRHVELVELVNDFVARMNAAGNPGTHWESVEGRILKRRTPGWVIQYGSSDAHRALPIRIDGRVPHRDRRKLGVYAPIEESGHYMESYELKRLAAGMAKVLAENNVR